MLPLFAEAEEHFIAALATRLKPEVYLPEAFVLMKGQLGKAIYFIERGRVQVTWASDTKNMLNRITIEDYFGELGLFVNEKLKFTVRAETHLDTYRLDRGDFEWVMKDFPQGALHVAARLPNVLPHNMARKAEMDIYDYAGLNDFFPSLRNRRWRAPKGFAGKLRNLAQSNQLQRSLAAQQQGIVKKQDPLNTARTSTSMSSGSPTPRDDMKVVSLDEPKGGTAIGSAPHADPVSRGRAMVAAGGGGVDPALAQNLQREVRAIADAQKKLQHELGSTQKKVAHDMAEAHKRMEEQLAHVTEAHKRQESVLMELKELALQASMPPGWEVKTSATTGAMYFHNPTTKETTWDRPKPGGGSSSAGPPSTFSPTKSMADLQAGADL